MSPSRPPQISPQTKLSQLTQQQPQQQFSQSQLQSQQQINKSQQQIFSQPDLVKVNPVQDSLSPLNSNKSNSPLSNPIQNHVQSQHQKQIESRVPLMTQSSVNGQNLQSVQGSAIPDQIRENSPMRNKSPNLSQIPMHISDTRELDMKQSPPNRSMGSSPQHNLQSQTQPLQAVAKRTHNQYEDSIVTPQSEIQESLYDEQMKRHRVIIFSIGCIVPFRQMAHVITN